MTRRRLPMSKIREVIRMDKHKISQRKIAKALGISRQKVAEYLGYVRISRFSWDEIEGLSDSELIEVCSDDNQSNSSDRHLELIDRFPAFAKDLMRTGVTKQLLWEEYRQTHEYGYGYTQFCHHFKIWKQDSEISMHLCHKVGDKLFVDFAGKTLSYIDPATGQEQPTETFIATLASTGLTYVEITASQQKEDWIKANDNCLRFLGGAPRAIVPDCLKSAVTKTDKYEPDINQEYADFARHYNTVILPARPGKPKDKALVENAVSIMYKRIYAPLRNRKFYSLDDLNDAVRELLEKHNNMQLQRMKVSRRELFEQIEKSTLQSLPAQRYQFKKFAHVKAHINYHVFLKEDVHYYSIPYRYRGKKVTIIYTNSTVEIFYDHKRIAFHKRDRQPYKYTTVSDHMPSNHRHYADCSPQRILNMAAKIGSVTKEFCQTIINSKDHPEQAFKTCMGIISLGKKYENTRINNACARAAYYGVYRHKKVKEILLKNLDKQAEYETPMLETIPFHKNIRGNQYYGVNND